MTAAAHSKLGASSMYRWGACPGSVRQSAGLANKSSRYAEEGTDAHTLAAHCVEMGFKDPIDLVDRTLTNTQSGPSFLITPDMAEAVAVYVDYIQKLCMKAVSKYVEQRFDLSDVHAGCFGTADCVVWNSDDKVLEVIDYKHGAGIPVEVEGNSQLQYYGLGALLSLQLPARRVRLTIVQPRCEHPDGPVRSWEIDALDLLDFRTDLKNYAVATEDPKAPLITGDHCRFCPAAKNFPICPALDDARKQVAALEFSPVLSYDPEQLRKALDMRDAVKAWIKGLDEFAYAEAEAGRCPPGYKLVEKRATRKWVNESDAEDAIALLPGNGADLPFDDIFEPRVLKSPAVIEKLIGKADFKKHISQYCESKSSGHTLVAESDKRQSLPTGAAADFLAIP